MVKRTTIISLAKEEMKFSAGHFTIFGPCERENLHGHNYNIGVQLEGYLKEDEGMMADYGPIKKQIISMCKRLNECFLLPLYSPHLNIKVNDREVVARFCGDILRFHARDIQLLPVVNVTIEELAGYFGQELIGNIEDLRNKGIFRILVQCSNGPG